MRFYPSGLLRRRTWSEFWIATRRAHKDRHAAVFVLRFAVAVVYLGAWLVFTTLAWFHDIGTHGAVFVVALGFITAAAVWLINHWTERREEQRIRALGPDVSPEITSGLLQDARMLAFLLDRVASERFLEKQLPAEITVITRRAHREKLNTAGLWEPLPSELRDLLLLPDGSWNAAQKRAAEGCLEYFFVLRWVLRFDSVMSPLDRRAEYSLQDIQQVLDPNPADESHEALPPWDVRAIRNETDQRFGRYWVEAIARGLVRSNVSEGAFEQAMSTKRNIDLDRDIRDLLVGANTISEMKDQQLLEEIPRCFHRWQILDILVPVLRGEKPISTVRELWTSQIATDAVAAE